jgi:hypothetical protein
MSPRTLPQTRGASADLRFDYDEATAWSSARSTEPVAGIGPGSPAPSSCSLQQQWRLREDGTNVTRSFEHADQDVHVTTAASNSNESIQAQGNSAGRRDSADNPTGQPENPRRAEIRLERRPQTLNHDRASCPCNCTSPDGREKSQKRGLAKVMSNLSENSGTLCIAALACAAAWRGLEIGEAQTKAADFANILKMKEMCKDKKTKAEQDECEQTLRSAVDTVLQETNAGSKPSTSQDVTPAVKTNLAPTPNVTEATPDTRDNPLSSPCAQTAQTAPSFQALSSHLTSPPDRAPCWTVARRSAFNTTDSSSAITCDHEHEPQNQETAPTDVEATSAPEAVVSTGIAGHTSYEAEANQPSVSIATSEHDISIQLIAAGCLGTAAFSTDATQLAAMVLLLTSAPDLGVGKHDKEKHMFSIRRVLQLILLIYLLSNLFDVRPGRLRTSLGGGPAGAVSTSTEFGIPQIQSDPGTGDWLQIPLDNGYIHHHEINSICSACGSRFEGPGSKAEHMMCIHPRL